MTRWARRSPSPGRGGIARTAGLVAGLLLAVALGTIAWLLRDPEPYFHARHSTLVDVDTSAWRLDGAVLEQDVTLRAASGLAVRLTVRRPTDTDDTPRPLWVILGGQRRGREAGALLGDTRGFIFASLDYPFDGDDRAKGLALVAQIPGIRRALLDTPPAVMLALDHLLARADVDSARVELVGASFGAPFATIAAALDERVTRLWIAHGGGDPYAMIEHGLKRDIPVRALRAPVAGAITLLASGPRMAPERWVGRVAPRPVILLNAEEDERIPRRAMETLWRATHSPSERIWLPGPHMQGDRPEVLERLVQTMLERAEGHAGY